MTKKKGTKANNLLAKNLLRGIAGNLDSHYKIETALKTIKKKTTDRHVKQALTTIRTSPVYLNNILTRHFNYYVPSKLVNIVEYSSKDILSLIENNESKLKKCLTIFFDIYEAIQSKDFSIAIENCIKLTEERGASLGLFRLLMFLYNQLEYSVENSHYISVIDALLKKIHIGNLKVINDGVRQLIDIRADFFGVCAKINNAHIDENSKKILQCFISHTPVDDKDFLESLNAHYSYSLLDSVLYINIINRLEFKSIILPTGIQDILNKISMLNINLSYYEGDNDCDSVRELSFYRESYLLIEQNDCLRYKTIHSLYFNTPKASIRLKTPYENRVISKYYNDVNNILDLRYDNQDDNLQINLDVYCPRNSSSMENSAAFSYLLMKNDGHISNEDKHEKVFIMLMSKTRDLAYTCSPEHFGLIKNNTSNLEIKLIVLCLLTAHPLDNDDFADFELRKVFQNLCISKHEGNILNTLKSFYIISPAISEYFLYSFDEVFISKLFNINVKPSEALEIRAELFEWYGHIKENKKYLDRAKNIRIDIQINKHQQHIDDARIYAEPARVNQWITDNILNDLVLQFDMLDWLNLPKFQFDWNNLTGALKPENEIAIAILRSYNEFVNNKLYGISSYLGRRIRHGTAKGTGVEEVKAMSNNEEYALLFLEPYFVEEWNHWLKYYISEFDNLIGDYFHIKSDKKPNGLLSPRIDTVKKSSIADSLVETLLKYYLDHDSLTVAPSIITDYCWRLLEGDLLTARQHILKVKSRISVFNIKAQKKIIHKRLAQKFSNEVNALTTEKFTLISSWFNKPSYASPSASVSLLFKIVIDEIQKQNPCFDPQIGDIDEDHILTGGQYFVIYDALTVIIKNIAEHGDETGTIRFISSIELPQGENSKKKLFVEITSEPKTKASFENSKRLILSKLNSVDIIDANIIEGNSGIKKLKAMQSDNLIKDINYKFFTDKEKPLISAIFSIKLGY